MALAALPVGDVEDAQAGDGLDALGKADDGLAANDNVTGGAAEAAKGDVNVADALHHEAAVHGLLGAATNRLCLERAVGLGLKAHGKGLVGVGIGQIDNVDALKVNASLLGGSEQGLAVAHDVALGQPLLGELAHNLHHLGVVSLKEGHLLHVGTSLVAQLLHKVHVMLLSHMKRHGTNWYQLSQVRVIHTMDAPPIIERFIFDLLVRSHKPVARP